MYYSATDIASFRTLRETILIGPRGAFGVDAGDLHARSPADLRAVMDRLIVHHGRGPELRASLARWGLDPAVVTRREKAFLPAWLTDQAVRGAIAVVVVPDPTLAYSGFVDNEERIVAAVRRAILPRPMTVSTLGRGILAAHEGVVLRRYRGRDGAWRIGIGHRARDGRPDPAFHPGDIDVQEAVRLFRRDLQRYEREVTARLGIGVEQHEFDALVSLHFGTGAFPRSEVARRLDNGDRTGAAAAFLAPTGHPAQHRRRMAEMILFRDGVYPRLTARVFDATPEGRFDRGRAIDLAPLLGFSQHDGRRGSLPPTIEERFILALTRVPGRLAGDVRETFLGLMRTVGIGKVASSLLVWNAGFAAAPLRMDLGLLAYDQAALSSPVVLATRSLAAALQELRDITGRDELAPVVDGLAAAISVLVVHRLFDRLLGAMKIARGSSVHPAERVSKPSLPKTAPRQARAPTQRIPKPAVVPPAVPNPADRPECVQLATELGEIEDAMDRAALADAVYDKPIDSAKLPDGWTEASPEALRELGLLDRNGQSYLEIPGNPAFRAVAFVNEKTNEVVVAFKGTNPAKLSDLANNYQQFMDQPSEYYAQAALIASQVSQAQGRAVEFVGHSLGGGLASAAAAAADKTATTFNAAGLNPATVPRYARKAGDSAKTKAYHVVGDGLSDMQDSLLGRMTKVPQAAGERIPLEPETRVALKDVAAALAGLVFSSPLGAAIAGAVYRAYRLHGMESVIAAMKKKARRIVSEQVKKGCVVG